MMQEWSDNRGRGSGKPSLGDWVVAVCCILPGAIGWGVTLWGLIHAG
jgi:hypothetical protein